MSRVPDFSVIETIEGIGTPDDLHPLQVAWMAHGCAQCGFCSPGFIMSAKVLLEENPDPTREEVRRWFQVHRNVCRCTGYKPLVDAVLDAAKVMRGELKRKICCLNRRTTRSSAQRMRAVGSCESDRDMRFWCGRRVADAGRHCSPRARQAKVHHGLIKGIDFEEAEKMPGVYKVITHKDVKGKNRISGLITFPTNKETDGIARFSAMRKYSSTATRSRS